MTSKTNRLIVLIIFCLIFLFPKLGMSLILVGGDEPIEDRDWPTGSVQMANLPTRVSWWAGPPFGTGSMYEFQYRCHSTSQFNEALRIFTAVRANKLELVIHNGPEYNSWNSKSNSEQSKEEKRVDWTFTVWNPESWDRLYNSPRSFFFSDHPNFKKPVAVPRVDVYIGGGPIVWKDVKIPKNLAVIDKRPGSVSPKFAGKGLVHGKVFDMATGKPIAGAQITLAKREDYRKRKEVMHGKTNEQGFCQIPKISLGYYEVRVRAEGYVPRKQADYNNKRPEYHQFNLGLARPSYVKGIVTDQAGNPIEGVNISATNIVGPDGFGYQCVGDRDAITDKQGCFEIRSLPKGMMSIGYQGKLLHPKNSTFERYSIPSDKIKLTMTGTGTIRGKVVDKDGKRPLGEIHLNIDPPGEEWLGKWGSSGRLSEDGTFDISGIPPGEYIISTRPNPSRGYYKPNTIKITVEAGKTYELEIIHAEQKLRR
jgi:5-hydroxyisourate hydrolase-like protein (transthyretin family)